MGCVTQRCLLLGGLVMVRGCQIGGQDASIPTLGLWVTSWVPTRHLAVVLLESQASSL